MNDVTRLLMIARGAMQARGHCKFQLEDGKGHICLVGALNVAHTGNAVVSWSEETGFWWEPGAAGYEAQQLLALVTGQIGQLRFPVPPGSESTTTPGRLALARWNNASERTGAEVLDAFDRAIKLAEEQGV